MNGNVIGIDARDDLALFDAAFATSGQWQCKHHDDHGPDPAVRRMAL